MADHYVSSTNPLDIPLERSVYVGIVLGGILYGVNVFMFFATAYCISHCSSTFRKQQKFYVVYGGVLLSVVTVGLVSDALLGQYAWIDHRNDPGGPERYLVTSQPLWYYTLGMATCVTTNILGDGLLVYRCYIFWNSQWKVLAVPVLIYLASSVTAITLSVEVAIVDSYLSSQGYMVVHLGMAWISLSVTLNIIVTSMICFRLLRMRALMREVHSPETSSMYTSIAAMLIESAAPFSILGICLVITEAKIRPFFCAFFFVWSMFCSLSPQMIILRVAMGRGWLKETVDEISTALVFVEPTTIHEQSQGMRTIYNTEERTFGPGMPRNSSDVSSGNRSSKAGVTSFV